MESHRSEKKRTIFWSAAAIILMVCIFGFSTQSGTESNGLSMKVTKFFAELLFFRFDSMDIGQQTFIITELNFFIRKLAHFTVYTALGMVVYTAVVSSGIKLRHKRLCSLAICALYASADEIHQYFVSERTMRLKDVFIDSIMEKLWEDEAFVDDNTLTVNVTRLRRKLEDAGVSDYIRTKKGVGYIIS